MAIDLIRTHETLFSSGNFAHCPAARGLVEAQLQATRVWQHLLDRTV